MALKKRKTIILVSFLAVFVLSAVFFGFSSKAENKITEDLFPRNLNGLPLEGTEQESPDEELIEGMSAYYFSDAQEISVLVWRAATKQIARDAQDDFIPEVKAQFASMFDNVNWSSSYNYPVGEGKTAPAITYRAYLYGEYIDGGIIFIAIEDYFILVHIISIEGTPSSNDLTGPMRVFVKAVSRLSSPPPPPPGEQEEEEEEEEEIVCGNGNCEYWQGEDCKTCVYDCRLPGFCCFVDYSYILARDYHNEIYDIKENEAGLIPKGAIIIYPEKSEKDLPFPYMPSICDGVGMKTGECVYNDDCPSGVCAAAPYHYCVGTVSEDIEEVEDEEISEKIYGQATDYKKEYVEAYEQIEGGIGQIIVKDADLEINLEVQGATAGKVPKVSEGDDIEVRLEIINNSDYNLGVAAGIFYPGKFDLKEKKYTISFAWEGGISSLIGSFKTKLINSRLIVMPSGSKVVVYSNVVPQETGYLDVQGLVFFFTEKKYKDYNPGLLDEIPKDYQETEVSESILVEEKPCNWWPICI